jgi:hypothetical protein
MPKGQTPEKALLSRLQFRFEGSRLERWTRPICLGLCYVVVTTICTTREDCQHEGEPVRFAGERFIICPVHLEGIHLEKDQKLED